MAFWDSEDWYYFDAGRVVTERAPNGQVVQRFKRFYQRGPMYMTESEAAAERLASPSWARAFKYGPSGWREVKL